MPKNQVQSSDSELIVRGDLLREARDSLGLSVASVANQLLMSPQQVRQLEEGSFKSFYSQQHVWLATRRYVSLLKLPLEEIVNDYRKVKS